jgi:hypothetical protein
MNGSTNDAEYMSINTPATPDNDLSYGFSAAFAVPTYPTEVPLFCDDEEYMEKGATLQHEFVIQPQKDPYSGGMDHFPYGPNSQEISM